MHQNSFEIIKYSKKDIDHDHLDCVFHVFMMSVSYRHSSHPAQSLWMFDCVFLWLMLPSRVTSWSRFIAVLIPYCCDWSLPILVSFELELRISLCWTMEPSRTKKLPNLSMLYGMTSQNLNYRSWLHVLLQIRNLKSLRREKLLPSEKQWYLLAKSRVLRKQKLWKTTLWLWFSLLRVGCSMIDSFCRHLWSQLLIFFLIFLCRSLRSLHKSPMSHHLLQKEFLQVFRDQPFTKDSILSVSHLHSMEDLHHLKKWVQNLNPWLWCPNPLLIVLETLLDGFMDLLDLMSCIAWMLILEISLSFWRTITAECAQSQVLYEWHVNGQTTLQVGLSKCCLWDVVILCLDSFLQIRYLPQGPMCYMSVQAFLLCTAHGWSVLITMWFTVTCWRKDRHPLWLSLVCQHL